MNTEAKIEQTNFQTGRVTIVSIAHAVHDTYASFLPPLLPVLIEKFSLSNTMAGFLSISYQIPSLLQPLIGHLADRTNLKLLLILAPTFTGAAMSLLSIAPSYSLLILLIFLAGTSSSTLHAIGPVMGSSLAGERLGRGMSFWMVGGELGRALGPIITVTAIAYLTLERFPLLMFAGVLASIFLYGQLNTISTKPLKHNSHINWIESLKKMRKLMIPLSVVIFTRALAIASITTFLPTFLTREGASLLFAGASLTILEIAGMAGAFLSGGLSDKFGRRKLLAISYIATPILILLFINVHGFYQIPLLILLGFSAISAVPVIMAIVLENYPDNRSFANGVFMATNFLIMAVAIFLVGVLSDLVNLRFTFIISAYLLPIGLIFIHLLPNPENSLSNID